MRDDIRENEGFEKENDINTESEANGIVKDMLCDNEGQEQVEEKLEADAEVLQAEGADNGEKESAAFEEEEAPCEEEKDACEKPLTGKDLTGDTRTCSDKKKGKKKKGKVAIISAITAAVLVFAIVIGTLLTTLLIGLGVVAVGGIGAVGLILFDMAEMQDVEIDPPLDNNVDMGFDEEMKEVTIEAEGFLARALCHEYDHLNGILYIDKVEGELYKVSDLEDAEEDEE